MPSVRVSVPATSANLGPGFDCLGLALALYNTINLSEAASGHLEVHIEGQGAADLPTDASNVVVQSAQEVFQAAGRQMPGLYIHLVNAVPPGSGLGSSAAAIVGGMLAANAWLGEPFSREQILEMAVRREGHPDNVVPAMCGGLAVSSAVDEVFAYARVTPYADLRVVIAKPAVSLSTEAQRAALPAEVSLKDAAANIGRAALVVQALQSGDLALLSQVITDKLHVPYRQGAIPGYAAVCQAALKAGAAAVTISGAGPSLIAFCQDGHEAAAAAMQRAFEAAAGPGAQAWVLPVAVDGARVQRQG